MSVKDKNRITAAVIALVVIVALIFVKKFAEGKIDSVESLQRYVLTFGIFAPLVLVLTGTAGCNSCTAGIFRLCCGCAFVWPYGWILV